MSGTDVLRELIGEMTRAEKRYFSLASSIHEGRKEWVELFDFLEAGKTPPVKDKSSISQAVMRNYLQERLLGALASYHRPHLTLATLQERALQARILLKKGLYRFAEKRIRALIRDAQEQEQWLGLLEILPLQRQLSQMAPRIGLSEAGYLENFQLENEAHLHLTRISEYEKLQLEFIRLQNSRGQIGHPDLHPDIQRFLENPLLKDETQAINHQSRLILFSIKSRLHRELGDWDMSHQYRKNLVEEHERFPQLIKENNQDYVNALLFLYTSASRVNDDAAIQQIIARMGSVPGTHREETDLIRLKGWMLQCLRVLNLGTYSETLNLARSTGDLFDRYQKRISSEDQLMYMYSFAYLYFGASKYQDSLRWILRILHETRESDRVDIHVAARIIFLIIHFELGNASVLRFAIRSLYRMLLRLNRNFAFEQAVLAMIRKFPSLRTHAELEVEFRNLLALAEDLQKDPIERKAFDFFHYRAWLESKLNGSTFAEMVQRHRKESGSAA